MLFNPFLKIEQLDDLKFAVFEYWDDEEFLKYINDH